MDSTKRPTSLSGAPWRDPDAESGYPTGRRRVGYATRAAAAAAVILGGLLSAISPAKAWDCGDLPCADTRSWIPKEVPESATSSGCVRSFVRSHKYTQREAIINNAGWMCGMDAALARLVAEDELRSEGR